MKAVSEVLGKAADLIERVGHWHGSDEDVSNATCAANAIQTIGLDNISTRDAWVALLRFLGHGTESLEPIYAWNDRTPTAEVLAAMRAAAAVERAREAEREEVAS